MFEWDALLLARIQFAFTVSFHIIFPSITIGLASFLAVLEACYLKTKQPLYRQLYLFWSKIFAINFGMGVVSGLVMAFQFGTNWSGFSQFAGSVTGPLLTYEVMTAFFLEAGFLGVMLFGWNKVGPKLHFFATCMVALGTLMSTFWILASNSWMQTPQGFVIENGVVVPTDWIAIIFNPSFPYRLLHMTVAAYICSALFVIATAAWHLRQQQHQAACRKMLSMGLGLLVVLVPVQILIGDLHGLNTLEYQPAKIAAIEGHFHNHGHEPTPLKLIGWPDMDEEKTHYALEIPKLGSLILTHSLDKQVPALTEFSPENRPNATIVFWSFRIMVGLGMLMLVLTIWGNCLRKQQWQHSPKFLRFAFYMGPSGLLAVLAGWFTTEVGRQPWVVYGVQRTADAVSNHGQLPMTISLVVFIVVYCSVFGMGCYYLWRLLVQGPPSLPQNPQPTWSFSGRLETNEPADNDTGNH